MGLGRSNVGGNRGQALDRRERHRPVHGQDDARGIWIHGIQQVVGQAQQTGEGFVELRIAQCLGPHELVPQPFSLRRGRIVDRRLGPGSLGSRRDLFRHHARLRARRHVALGRRLIVRTPQGAQLGQGACHADAIAQTRVLGRRRMQLGQRLSDGVAVRTCTLAAVRRRMAVPGIVPSLRLAVPAPHLGLSRHAQDPRIQQSVGMFGRRRRCMPASMPWQGQRQSQDRRSAHAVGVDRRRQGRRHFGGVACLGRRPDHRVIRHSDGARHALQSDRVASDVRTRRQWTGHGIQRGRRRCRVDLSERYAASRSRRGGERRRIMLDRGNQTWVYALRSTDRRATQ